MQLESTVAMEERWTPISTNKQSKCKPILSLVNKTNTQEPKGVKVSTSSFWIIVQKERGRENDHNNHDNDYDICDDNDDDDDVDDYDSSMIVKEMITMMTMMMTMMMINTMTKFWLTLLPG